jgi:hypothetical protein
VKVVFLSLSQYDMHLSGRGRAANDADVNMATFNQRLSRRYQQTFTSVRLAHVMSRCFDSGLAMNEMAFQGEKR